MTHNDLKNILNRIDEHPYKAYKEIKSTYVYPSFTLIVEHVQGDPFAVPSKIRVQVGLSESGFPADLLRNRIRKVAFRDFLAREFHNAIGKLSKGSRGIGKSGLLTIDHGGQEVLERNSVVLDGDVMEARFFAGLPARGRTILGKQAQEMFFREIPAIVERAMFYKNINPEAIRNHVETVEDGEALRSQLHERRLVGFAGNGAMLPRKSGVDNRPLKGAVLFASPPECAVTLKRPNRGELTGMGVPEGVTLIVGGGFHGKSTLLKALELGVYNHIPGDGRETVVALPGAVKIRAEDGRRVEKVNISPFINNLPLKRDTTRFSTDNASGSTSQAANIMESLECGAQVIFIDEDTSATNFMIRDQRMQELVTKEKEPITPFLDRVCQLYDEWRVSTIIVMGGSGDYFDVADTVIMMDEYRPLEVTSRVKEIMSKHTTKRKREAGGDFGNFSPRIPDPRSFNPSRGNREFNIRAWGTKTLNFGKEEIDLSSLEQLVDPAQTRAVGMAIYYYASHILNDSTSLEEGLKTLMKVLATKGLDVVSPIKSGDLAMPRMFEIAGGINRMRSLVIK